MQFPNESHPLNGSVPCQEISAFHYTQLKVFPHTAAMLPAFSQKIHTEGFCGKHLVVFFSCTNERNDVLRKGSLYSVSQKKTGIYFHAYKITKKCSIVVIFW